ncbi:hypothetical protein BHE74_00041299 [Ensete ventricosum]|nr:hypothetical protein GW17_00015308 [Ensete ventricosum]RWW52286.1 hypothetical protein BHE74_00041299 [Ensete ventricosum]RZS00960.1 hypothetical protein BHM03_00030744 [Ensete ventricosum]
MPLRSLSPAVSISSTPPSRRPSSGAPQHRLRSPLVGVPVGSEPRRFFCALLQHGVRSVLPPNSFPGVNPPIFSALTL